MADHTSSVYIAYVIRTGVGHIPVASRGTSCEHRVTRKLLLPTEIRLTYHCHVRMHIYTIRIAQLKRPLAGAPNRSEMRSVRTGYDQSGFYHAMLCCASLLQGPSWSAADVRP